MRLYNIHNINSEEEAADILRSFGILREFNTCIHCNSPSLGHIRRRKVKCYRCKKEWSQYKGSLLERIRISSIKFLLVVKCYELNIGRKHCAIECRLKMLTVSKIYRHLDKGIMAQMKFMIVNKGNFTWELGNNILTSKFANNDESESEYLSLPLCQIQIKRIRSSVMRYGNIIVNTNLSTEMNKQAIGKASRFIRELQKHLDQFSSRNENLLDAMIYKVCYFYLSKSSNLYVQLLKLCENNMGGKRGT